MQVTDKDIDNLLGPIDGNRSYGGIKFVLAQGLLRIQAGYNVPYKTLTQLENLQLIGDNGILKKGRVFLFEQLEVRG